MPHVDLKDGGRLHYEEHGQGEPLLLLNGIMMNTLSWAEFVPFFAARFRLILLDFRDQGQSSRHDRPYDLESHAADLLALLDGLGLARAHVVGLSYGGQVALRFAVGHRERLQSLVLANVACDISNHLRAIGQAWERAAELADGERFFQLAIPFIYSADFYERSWDALKQRQELFKTLLTKEWFEALVRLNRSVAGYSVSPEELRTITVPTLLIGAEDDMLVPLRRMDALHESLPDCEFVTLRRAGHGAFLERKKEFMTLVSGFVAKHSRGEAEAG